MSSGDITMNAYAAFLAALGASLASADEWLPEDRTSDEILEFLQEVLEESTMNSENLSEREKTMVLSLFLSFRKAVQAHKI